LGGVVKTAQETASKLSAEIDGRILKCTFDTLDEDRELEQFFEGIPGFCSSKVVKAPRRILGELDNSTLTAAIEGFLDRTCSSSLLSQTARERRAIVCMRAVDALDYPFPSLNFLTEVFERGMDGVLRSVQMGHSLRNRCHSCDNKTALYAQGIVAGIIARAPERDDRWKALVKGQLAVSEDGLRDYLGHGDSVLLANLMHVTRQSLRYYRQQRGWSSTLLIIQPTISKFDIQNTLPGLKHDFCALWNEIALQASNDRSHIIPLYLLRPIRHLYIASHQGTDATPTAFSASTADNDSILELPSSYPLCNIPGHQPHIYETTHSPSITSITPSTGPVTSSLPPSTPDHSRIHTVDDPSLDNLPDATPIIQSLGCHRSPPVNVENHHFATTSLDPATAIATEIPTDAPTVFPVANPESGPSHTPADSTSISPLSITLPSSSTVDPQYNADLPVGDDTPSMVPGISSSLAPVSNDTLLGNPLTSSASPALRINEIAPCPESCPSSSARTIPSTVPRVTSVSQANLARNDATLDIHDFQAPDVLISGRPHKT
jgi:hypothetical protein